MKLIVYETTHHENIPAILDLAVARSFTIAVFLDEISYENLRHEIKNKWPGLLYFRRTANQGHRDFIHTMFRFARKELYTHVHLCTLSNNYLYIAWKLSGLTRIQVSLTVHEINHYRTHSFRNLREISESIAKVYLHKRIKRFRALIPRMKTELEKHFHGSRVFFIPSRFYDFSSADTKSAAYKIVVPGTVENKRRDYEFLVRFLSGDWFKSGLKQPVELVLLGNSGMEDAEEIIRRVKKAENQFVHIICYEKEVPAAEYARQMEEARLVWSPINLLTEGSRGQTEVYGITKSPGLTADLLQFPKPSLVPAAFDIPYYFRNAMIPYSGETDLLMKMKQVLETDNSALMQEIKKDLAELVVENFIPEFDLLMQVG